MSDQDKRGDDAEPVDAEFEPAPDDSGEAGPETRSGGGTGPVKLVLFIAASALIGGASGFVLSRQLPAEAGPGGDAARLEARVAALEANDANPAQLAERISRLESTVSARNALPGRVDALQTRVSELEAAGGGAPGDGDAAALRTRLDEAVSQIRDRLDALEDQVETARGEADAARSAAGQANAALGRISTGAGADGAPPDSRLAALSGRVDALDRSLGDLRDAVRGLEDLPARVEALADGAGASGPAAADLTARLETLTQRLSGLDRRVDALERGPSAAPEPAGLAARALAFAALSEAASGDQPFAVELEALARVWPQAPGLDALRPVAREGAPTADRLEDSFPAEALRQATGEAKTYFGVLRVAREEDAGAAARIAGALAEDDLAAAARTVGELDEAGRDALGDWRAGLAARLRVREALSAQSAALAAAGDAP